MIKTIQQIKKEFNTTYYKCHCEYCNGDFAASAEDLHESSLHFGMPTVADDEYVWKCPTCGHPNINKKAELTKYQLK